MSDETITPADLALLREARLAADAALKNAEIIQLRIFVRYGLRPEDSFDMTSGKVTRFQAQPAPLRLVTAPPEPESEPTPEGESGSYHGSGRYA
jgi:hypothetical protein